MEVSIDRLSLMAGVFFIPVNADNPIIGC